MYRFIIRPILFLFNPEQAHHIASFFLKIAAWPLFKPLFGSYIDIKSHDVIEIMGLKFPSRLGMAAGFDKDAKMLKFEATRIC